MPEAAETRRGAALVAVTIGAGSLEPLVVRASALAISPAALLVARNVVAAIVVIAVARGLRRVSSKATAQLVAVGLLLFLTSALGLVAFARLPVAVAVTVVSITPIWVGLAVARRARLGPRFFAGSLLGVVGVALTAGAPLPGAEMDAVGLGCALGATLSSAAYRLQVEALGSTHPPERISSYAYAVGAVLALASAPLVTIDAATAARGAVVGIGAAVSNLAFVAAVAALGAARTSVLLLLQRPVVILLAVLFLGERVGALELAGVVLVLVAVVLARRPPAERTK